DEVEALVERLLGLATAGVALGGGDEGGLIPAEPLRGGGHAFLDSGEVVELRGVDDDRGPPPRGVLRDASLRTELVAVGATAPATAAMSAAQASSSLGCPSRKAQGHHEHDNDCAERN